MPAHLLAVPSGGLCEVWRCLSKLAREFYVEIRIGVSQSMKEIDLDLGDVDRESVLADITKTLADDDAVLWLTDKKGRTVGVPASKVAYVEVGAAAEERKVGFAR